jgi:hypothetical protein
MARFPSRVEELRPDLLSEILAERHPGVVVREIDVVQTSQCGDGFASTADRIVLGLTYAPGCDAGLPERMLLKTMLEHPHAPASMYQNEVRFYREVRHDLAIEAPTAYGSMFDRESGQFGVLMEDLSLRSARFPNAVTPVGVEEVRGLVRTLAALHARFWESPRLADDLGWVPTPRSGGMYRIFHGIGLDLIKDQVEKNPFKADLIEPLGRSLDELWSDLWKLQAILDGEPRTLLHGDPHIANTYLLPDADGGFLDWQLMVKGLWSHDLTYLLVTGLEPEDRRKHEREMIRLYLDALGRGGVASPPTRDEAFTLDRKSVGWGLVIGWLITPPQNYGESITVANLTRLVAAMQDLETLAALHGES